MTPPDMLDEQAADRSTTLPTGPPWSDRAGTDANLRTELVHRHLAARIGVAEEQLQILEDHSPAPEVLVARFGATITEAQAVLDRERAEVAAAGRAPSPGHRAPGLRAAGQGPGRGHRDPRGGRRGAGHDRHRGHPPGAGRTGRAPVAPAAPAALPS